VHDVGPLSAQAAAIRVSSSSKLLCYWIMVGWADWSQLNPEDVRRLIGTQRPDFASVCYRTKPGFLSSGFLTLAFVTKLGDAGKVKRHAMGLSIIRLAGPAHSSRGTFQVSSKVRGSRMGRAWLACPCHRCRLRIGNGGRPQQSSNNDGRKAAKRRASDCGESVVRYVGEVCAIAESSWPWPWRRRETKIARAVTNVVSS
jgi:hypothetical protein